jgi:hypothetical protein
MPAGFPRIPPSAAAVWLAGVGLAVLLGLLAATGKTWSAAAATLAVMAVAYLYARVLGLRQGMVVLLILTATLDRFTYRVGPLDLRAEQVAALLALLALAVTAVRGRDWSWLRPNLAEAAILAWLALNLVSSLLASPDRLLSIKVLAVYAISSLGLFLPRRVLSDRGSVTGLETVVTWLLVVMATEAAYSTLIYLLHALGPTISVGINPASGYLGAYGTLWEQNVLGGFCAAGVVAWSYLAPRRLPGAWAGIAACIGGLVDSVTRAAWLATVAVVALGFILPGSRRRLDLKTLARGAAGGLVLIVATLVATRLGRYNYSLPGTVGPTGPSVGGPSFLTAILNRVDLLGRFNQVPLVWSDIRDHVLLGRGTAAFEALHQYHSIPEHLASLPLNLLDGSGFIGLALFVAFGVVVTVRAWARRANGLVHALGQLALVLVITNLSTETLELMIGWLLIGLLLAAIDDRALRMRL